MCGKLHPNSFLAKTAKEINKRIGRKKSAIRFNKFLPPRLCHLENCRDMRATVNNALGEMIVFLVKRYDALNFGNEKMEVLMNTVFEIEIDPARFAAILIETAKAVSREIRLTSADGTVYRLTEPSDTDLGSKRIYFSLLNMLFDLSANLLAGNGRYSKEFEEKEKEIMNLMSLIAFKNENPVFV